MFIVLNERLGTVTPAQNAWLAMELTCPAGFTVIVKVLEMPVHDTPLFEKIGVTVILAVTGDGPGLFAGKEGIFPVPVAGSPIVVLSFIQVYSVVPPELVVVKMI